MATYKTIVHKTEKDSYLVIINSSAIGSSTLPTLLPITSNLEAWLKYSDIDEDLKEYIEQEYMMVLVDVTVFDGK